MSREKINLNLTRKWRSKSFDQIVGQELSVRMLKNSLYLNQFFPVYLFSGQRGCGKTSTARVFAAAINCVNLSSFQKNPKKFSLPCLKCDSCKSMLSGNHPDFIEIDAASHTGVDNVRQIIESSSFMPLMGNKKVYLIDEAHMLSKAAFNAFLKVLEEPPASVIFILATTAPQKIIETVRSRCFQLFFKSVEHKTLVKYLQYVCEKEKISHDMTGLGIIVTQAQGSVRDSLNILEQVRFSSGSVKKDSVQNVLGHIDDESLLQLFECLLASGPHILLKKLKDLKYELFSPQYLWKKIIDLIRDSVWIKHGVIPNNCSVQLQKLDKIIKKVSWERLNFVMQLFYENETVFIKTTEKHSLLEMILIQATKKNDTSNISGASCAPSAVLPIEDQELQEEYVQIEEEDEYEEEEEASSNKVNKINKVNKNINNIKEDIIKKSDNWDAFLIALEGLKDPLLISIFKTGKVIAFDNMSGNLEVEFSKQFLFYEDALNSTQALWLPLLNQVYAKDVTFKPLFTGEVLVKAKKNNNINGSSDKKIETQNIQTAQKTQKNNYPKDYASFKKNNKSNSYGSAYGRSKNKNNNEYSINSGKLIDVSDVAAWKKANTLLKYFPGSIREV